jgi:hypothetical protein
VIPWWTVPVAVVVAFLAGCAFIILLAAAPIVLSGEDPREGDGEGGEG